MPPRIQKTPHGDVSLTSKWMRDHYVLCAYGPNAAVRWMFPKANMASFEIIGDKVRHAFKPGPQPITIERDLRRICAKWLEHWDHRLQDAIETPTTAAVVPATLKQAYEHHQAHYVGLLGNRTQEQYPARMQEWLDYLGQNVRLEEVTAEAILAARAKMQRDRKSSNSTINGKVSTLKKVLNMALRKGWVTTAPWRDVPPLRLIREPVRYWNQEQVAVAFAAACKDDEPGRATLMLVLGIYLGLRKNEAVHVRWQDLHLDRLHPQTGQPSPICLIEQRPGFTTKTYENRKVPIAAEAKALLLQHKPAKAKPGDYVLDAERHHQKRGGTKRVYRYDPVKVWLRVLKAAMAAGNPQIEFKEMRHSFACNCLGRGHNVEKVARWLGHKDPRMVRQHYAFLLDYDDDTGLKFLSDE
jgi:integrase